MYSLFNEPPVATRGGLTFPHYKRMRDRLQQNLDTVVSYYRRSPRYIPSSHILVQIIEHLNISLHQDLAIYRDKVTDISDDIARSLRITSPVQAGVVKPSGEFYGKSSTEVLISMDTQFSLTSVRDDWENLQPVRWLRHPKTDLNMEPPLGKNHNEEPGLSVLTIDIPMLACQYRQWALSEHSTVGDVRKSIMSFVVNYPLTNSLYSQLDVAVMNRFTHRLEGAPTPTVPDQHPFHLGDYSGLVDDAIDKVIVAISRRTLRFDVLLDNLVPITQESFRDVIELPRVPTTRQITWALVLARLPVIELMGFYKAITGSQIDRADMQIVLRSIREAESDRRFTQGLPPEIKLTLLDEIETIKELLA